MTTKNGGAPYVREWIEHVLGSQMMKETWQLSQEQREKVRRMMSPKKYTNLIHELPTRWNSFEILEKIAKEIWGDVQFAPVLFFHPKIEKHLVDAIFEKLANTPSV